MAVLLMVMVHAAATWNPFSGAQQSILAYIVSGLGGLAAPLFLTLFGWGTFYSNITNKARIFQASFLFLAQILVNITSPHLFNTFTPGILSLMAILTLILPLLSKAIERLGQRIFLILIILTITIQFFYPEVQGNGGWEDRVDGKTLPIFLSNLLLTGTYPLFPWFVFPILGAIITSNSQNDKHTLPLNNYTKAVMVTGLLFCITTLGASQYNGHLWAHPSAEAYLTFFPANAAFMIAAMTGVLLIWAFVQHFQLLWLNNTGKISLTIYIVHFIPLSLMHQYDTKYDWGLNTSASIVVLYTLLWIPISIIWMKNLPRLNLEALFKRVRKSL